ncbi:hypothetical protein GCM10012275_61440 [Longimycelium tulufanense]|uniref:Uncharacterized protein n=1 Tax=Longimycelium tulufanense TaxID=907463 RepID=A0A8J3CLD5_9PSEU|nr:DUF6409 family protein [Longimycelium tulufanense]GGM82562.1 hypothetical protein GCM10012275_61440 [Longimycelium tulufanense]
MQTTTVPQLPEKGSVITARPWQDGQRQAKAVRGLVVQHVHTENPTDAYIVVWFPALGAPAVGDPDTTPTVQAILPREIDTVATLDQLPATWVITTERTARHTRRTGGYDIGLAAGVPLERLARTYRAARNQRRQARTHTPT